MQNRSSGGPSLAWAWACVAILVSGVLTLYPLLGPVGVVPGYALGSLYPALLLVGALGYAGRRAPAWLAPAALAWGAVRGVLYLAGLPVAAHALALAAEPALALLSAVVVARSATRGSPPFAHRLLPPALGAMAIFEAVTALGLLSGNRMPDAMLVGWLGGAPVLLAIQLAAWGERSRRDLERARELLEQRVEEQTERYRIVSELSTDFSFAFRTSPEGHLHWEWVTDALVEATGYSAGELAGRHWFDLFPGEATTEVLRRAASVTLGSVARKELRIVTKDGEERWLRLRFAPPVELEDGWIRMVGAGRDITDRVRAEAERRRIDLHVRELQRLDSLGRLAGGIAHDFNNALTVVLGNLRLAKDALPADAPAQRSLSRVRAAAEHAAALTEQILTYSGKAAVRLEPLDLSRLVHETSDLLGASASERARLVTELSDGLPAVEGDATQIRQVLLNLVTNAGEALGEEGGTIRVRTGVREVDAAELEQCLGAPDPRPGSHVFLEVCDDGAGLDPEVQAHIFEPFFTTRAGGRGVGLAAVLGIVHAHGGVIRVESDPGRGTRFEVLLPGSQRAAAPPPPTAEQAAASDPLRVLLIDDDEAVLEVGAELLGRVGYEVATAREGREAVRRLEDDPAAFDAVVLDLVMPGLSSEETFLALRSLRPDLPVVLASGYDREQAAERFSARGISDFLRKPYEPEALVSSLRSATTRASAG